MATKCPLCGNQALSEGIQNVIDRKDLQIQRLKARLWDLHTTFQAYKQISTDGAAVLSRERLVDREETRKLRRRLGQVTATNRKGTPGYRNWLTKFRAARTASA